jgi:hypothetical protein
VNVAEAKAFLIQQTAEQAALDAVPLSGLEKRMMRFTESPDASEGSLEDPFTLNSEFEAEHDREEYEAKISDLLKRSHKRLKKEKSDKARTWDEAVKVLKKGDHYVLVLL